MRYHAEQLTTPNFGPRSFSFRSRPARVMRASLNTPPPAGTRFPPGPLPGARHGWRRSQPCHARVYDVGKCAMTVREREREREGESPLENCDKSTKPALELASCPVGHCCNRSAVVAFWTTASRICCVSSGLHTAYEVFTNVLISIWLRTNIATEVRKKSSYPG